MTHISQFKYSPSFADYVSAGKSSEVRVRYFDPRTGEPCDEKPSPLCSNHEEQTSYERNAKRMADIEEAAEIMRNMQKRKEAKRKTQKRNTAEVSE